MLKIFVGNDQIIKFKDINYKDETHNTMSKFHHT